MPPKRIKSKISFKVFSADNYSKFANRFPFLKERQIKAKLLQAWRNRFTSQTTSKGKEESKKTKQQSETTFIAAKCDTPSSSQEDDSEKRSECSPLLTYSNRRCQKNKLRECLAKDKRNQKTSIVNNSSPCSSEKEVCSSKSSQSPDLADKKSLKKQKTTQGKRKGNEVIDLFEEISAEELLIEPVEITYVSDSEVVSSTPVPFNHKEWLEKLTKQDKDEKNSNTVSGMFKWRADRKSKTTQKNKDESNYESRFLVSNDDEGCSNFLSMFDEQEDIFL